MSDIIEKNIDPSLLDLESNYAEQSAADTEPLSPDIPHAEDARKGGPTMPTSEELSIFALIALLCAIWLTLMVRGSREQQCGIWYSWALRTSYEAFIVVAVSCNVRGWMNNSGIRAWIVTMSAIFLSACDESYKQHWC